MAIRYQTKAFLLKEENRGEADKFFLFYTEKFGKIFVLAKAVRKIKSKLRGGVGLFSLSEIEFIQGKNYKTLTDAYLLDNFPETKNSLKKIFLIQKISDILDKFIKGEEKDSLIWPFLKESAEKVENFSLKKNNFWIVYHYFAWNLFSILGYKIDLYDCSFCKNKLTSQGIYFNQEEGLICENCFQKLGRGDKVSPEIIKILRVLTDRNWEIVSKLKLNDYHRDNLNLILEKYIISLGV